MECSAKGGLRQCPRAAVVAVSVSTDVTFMLVDWCALQCPSALHCAALY